MTAARHRATGRAAQETNLSTSTLPPAPHVCKLRRTVGGALDLRALALLSGVPKRRVRVCHSCGRTFVFFGTRCPACGVEVLL